MHFIDTKVLHYIIDLNIYKLKRSTLSISQARVRFNTISNYDTIKNETNTKQENQTKLDIGLH